MNKQELIRAVAARGGLRVTDAAKAMSAFGDILKICMAEGERITWPGGGLLLQQGMQGPPGT